MQINGSALNQQFYRNAADCCIKMYRSEGVRSFYAGLALSLIKIAPASAIQFSVYDTFKSVQIY